MLSALGRTLRAVTFDCWNTLLAQAEDGAPHRVRREAALVRRVREAGGELDPEAAGALLDDAWLRHRDWMRSGRACGAREIARWALDAAGVHDSDLASVLAQELADAPLSDDGERSGVLALDGARDTLALLAERGLRLALICDTGYSPGRVVRRLLERHDLLEWLEVQVFSDEAGVPKPHARMFRRALNGLGTDPGETVHVGDLRATDVAGARNVGMASIRMRDLHDDTTPGLPEADAVADSHAHLRRLLGLS